MEVVGNLMLEAGADINDVDNKVGLLKSPVMTRDCVHSAYVSLEDEQTVGAWTL